jgi:hypothetical protein
MRSAIDGRVGQEEIHISHVSGRLPNRNDNGGSSPHSLSIRLHIVSVLGQFAKPASTDLFSISIRREKTNQSVFFSQYSLGIL